MRISNGIALIAIAYSSAAGGERTSTNAKCNPALIEWNAPPGACVTMIDGYALRGARNTKGKCESRMTQAAMDGGPCHFDLISRSFAGSPAVQAECLLKHVKKGGALGPSDVTPRLAAIIDTPALSLSSVSRFLDNRHIMSSEIGGPLVTGLKARYFVIHDTSTPNCSSLTAPNVACPTVGELPAARDRPDWSANRTFGGFAGNPARLKAQVVTNRVGGSFSARDFSQDVSHIRFDFCNDASTKTSLFVAVENIQPRIAGPGFVPPTDKDSLAPIPGFTDAQYERLALLYAVASARHGRWMIPAYHSPIDAYYAGGHDDPQNFDMAKFMAKLESIISSIQQS